MSNPSAGLPAPAAPAVVTPPANAESSLIEQAKKASTPAELKALREQYMKPAPVAPPPAKVPEEAPTEPAAEEQPPGDSAAEPAPGSEETPAPTDETPATEEGGSENPPADETPGGSEDDDDGEDLGEGPVTPHAGKRAHLRLSEKDEVGRLAASFMKRNRDWTMGQALQAAEKQLGIKPEQAAGGEGEPQKPKSNLPSTVEAVDSALEQLIAQKNAKMVSLEFEDVTKIDAAIRQLDRHRVTLERDAERQQSQQVTEYNRKYDVSQSRAAELYPFSVDPNSPGGKRMVEIERQLRENDDPLDKSPDKPMKIAQMVAAELNIAPRKKGAPAPAKAAAPATPPAPKKGVLPTGGSRTTVAPSTQPAINDEIGKIRTVADMRAFRQKHGLPI